MKIVFCQECYAGKILETCLAAKSNYHYLFIYLFVYLFIYLFIYVFIYSFIYLSIFMFSHDTFH